MNSETQKNLVLFFRNIADDIENNKLNENQLKSSGEFYMSYLFQKEVGYEVKDIDLSDKDFIKFLILGWYMYNIILQDDKNK